MGDRITWPVVALVGLILAAITTLGIAGVSTEAITQTLILLGLGGGLGVLIGVKNNVNGNLTEFMRLLRDAMDKLAKAQPITDDKEEK